ncbi:hypothetical protein SAMN05518847_109198 [Paenibacillus sp. OV219]|nr:hypothetical protein SAMN05518847_109198 [Paenibacillus sp. OV219]
MPPKSWQLVRDLKPFTLEMFYVYEGTWTIMQTSMTSL